MQWLFFFYIECGIFLYIEGGVVARIYRVGEGEKQQQNKHQDYVQGIIKSKVMQRNCP